MVIPDKDRLRGQRGQNQFKADFILLCSEFPSQASFSAPPTAHHENMANTRLWGLGGGWTFVLGGTGRVLKCYTADLNGLVRVGQSR